MERFRVWAPLPKRVEVQVDGRRHPMIRGADDYWSATVDGAGTGSAYGFVLDGEGPFPDPRSPWQPWGVHGLSRLWETGAYGWSDGEFRAPPLGSGVVYELHVGTFTPGGTLTSAIERLDELVGLGVTHVELMPVNAFPGERGWGYDGVALYAVQESYGGPAALQAFVEACHRRGMAVLLDVVYNHLGPSGNYLGKYGPYFNRRYHTPWGEALNFDGPDSEPVRRFFLDNALRWFREFRVDGLRLDAVHAIFDTSAEPFLEELGREVRALSHRLGRPLVLIPESDLNDPRLLWSRERGGYGLDAQWSDDFHHALHGCLTGERSGYYADFGTVGDLAKALRDGYVYDGRYSRHRRRRHGRPAEGLGGERFLGYLQNHDQVGNRAQGDRLSRTLGPGALKVGAALVLMAPFVPMLFMGEEWGATSPFQYFTDHAEPELGKAVREGRRREFASFGWKPEDIPDPQALATFERSRLDWAERERSPHRELLEWHRMLVALRRREPDLTDGRLDRVRTRHDESGRWLVMERGRMALAVNFGDRMADLPLSGGGWRTELASFEAPAGARDVLSLPPVSVAILRRD
ncbi:MAG: malto-oligosyltrehalose trehalohydrolase [Verrucomicrobiae bacterium]|nr:malto-oligosyltrehalose trehalohydrolase [Verrucomicrobiae bacterium]